MMITKLKKWIVAALSVCVFAFVGVAFTSVAPAPTATADTLTAEQSWDVSAAGDGSVKAYIYPTLTDGEKYDLVISGTGAMATSWTASKVPWNSIRAKIVSVTVEEGVTTIGNFSFNLCTALTSLELPSTITEIREKAFYGCGLTEITIPAAVKNVGANALNASKLYLQKVTFLGMETKVADSAIHADTAVYCYSNSVVAEWAKERTNVTYLDVVSLFKKVNVSLGADLTVKYYVALEASEANNAKIDFAINEYTMSDDSATLVGDLYEFSFTGVAPQWIGDTITATLTVGDKEEVKKYSVLQYCNAILGSDYATLNMSETKFEALKTLVVDLVNYGAAAQTFTGDTETVSVSGKGSTFVAPTETDEKITGALNGVEMKSADLIFNKANALKFYFTADSADLNVLLTKNGVPVMLAKVSDLAVEGGQYCVTTEAISATEFDDIYTLTVYGVDMTNGVSVSYSVQSYVYANQANESNANLAALVKALWVYGESAKAYANAQ